MSEYLGHERIIDGHIGLFCPIAGRKIKPGETVFTVSDRHPRWLNACTLCHDDKRNIADRLQDFETKIRKETK